MCIAHVEFRRALCAVVMSKNLHGHRLQEALNDAFYSPEDAEDIDIAVAEQVCVHLLILKLRKIRSSEVGHL